MGEKPVCNPQCKCNEEARFYCQGDDTYWNNYEKNKITGKLILLTKQ